MSESLQEQIHKLKGVYQELMEKSVEFGRLLNVLQSQIDKEDASIGMNIHSATETLNHVSMSTKKYLDASQLAMMINLPKSSIYKMTSSDSILQNRWQAVI